MSCISGIRRGIAEVAAYQRQQICRANSPAVHIAQRALSHAPRMMLQPSTRNFHSVLSETSRIETPKGECSFNLITWKIMKESQLFLDPLGILASEEASMDERYSAAKELAKIACDTKSPHSHSALGVLKRLSEYPNERDHISLLFASYALASTNQIEEEQMREFLKENLHISIRDGLRHERINLKEWRNFTRSDADNSEVRFLRDTLFSVLADDALANHGFDPNHDFDPKYYNWLARRKIRELWEDSDLNYESRIHLAASIEKIAVNDPDVLHEMIDLLTQFPKDLDKKFNVKKLVLLTLIQIGKATTDPRNTVLINVAMEKIVNDLLMFRM